MHATILSEHGSRHGAQSCNTLPDPAPNPHQGVIQVAFCGICAHDVAVAGIVLPPVPGHEIAGTIIAVGGAVQEFVVGERVATTQREYVCGQCRYCRGAREPFCAEQIFLGNTRLNGGYVEFVAVDADNVARVPDGVPLETASIAACAIGRRVLVAPDG